MDTSRSLPRRIVTILHAFPRRSLAAVLLFVALAGVVGGPVAGALDSEGGFAPTDSDSALALALERIEEATGLQPNAGILLLVETPDGDDSGVAAAVETLAGVDGVATVVPAGAAEDGATALVAGTIEASVEEEAVAAEVVEAFAGADDVTVGGPAVIGLQLGEQVEEDLSRAELMALPILVLLSILVFGGRAALLPLVVGITTVLGTFLTLAGINQVYGLSVFALNLVIGLGLGLAIDYTLFLVSRYREELARQGATLGAVRTTMATAGRTVVYSSATVAVALATLTLFPLGFLRTMGIAGAAVAVVAAASALVISPPPPLHGRARPGPVRPGPAGSRSRSPTPATAAGPPAAPPGASARAVRVRGVVRPGEALRHHHPPRVHDDLAGASTGSSRDRVAWTQLKRRSDSPGRWKRASLATRASRSSLGKANPMTASSSENAT